MKISHIYLLLILNCVTTVVTYYRKCYDEFSVCLVTNIDDRSPESRFRLSRASADDWCKRNSSSLVVITNANVQSALAAFFNDSSAKLGSDVITNGYRSQLNYWEWINGRRKSAKSPISERSYYRYAYVLVSAGRGVTLNASLPTTSRNFICSYLSHNSSCPNEQFGRSCYKIHNNDAATWFDARNLCLQEGYDLATFADIDLSTNSGWLSKGEYWVGLQSEKWNWLLDQRYVEIKYSNWDTRSPYATDDNCLCLTANTGKWKECDCYQKHRYICIEDYTPNSTAPTTARITTSTTKADSHSTLVAIVDDSFKQPDDSEDSGKKNNDSQRLIIWVPLAILIILIVVVVAWIVVKKYCKRNRNMLGGGSAKNKTQQHSSSVDAYATLNPETSTKNRTYDQLQLYETIGDNETGNNEPMLDGGSSKNKTNQSPSSVDAYVTLKAETSTDNRTYAQLQLYETIGDDETE